MKLTSVLALNVLAFSVSLTAPCRISAELREIQVGFIGPLSGDAAHYGIEARNAVNMALEEINGRGHVPGVRLRLVAEDARCNGKEATAAAQKLVSTEGVKIIIGGMCSTETLASAHVTEAAKVILLSPFSSNPGISDAGEYVFRNCINDLEGGARAADIVRERRFSRPAAISEQTDYCLGLRKSFFDSLERTHVKPVADETYLSADTDMRSTLLRIRKNNPDVLFVNAQTGVKGGLVLRQLRAMNWDVPVIGNNVFSSNDAIESAGGVALLEGMQFIDAPEVSTDKGKELLRRYEERFGAIQSTFLVAFAYDDAWIIADAIKAVGLDTNKIRDYLLDLPVFHGVAYDYRFDTHGDMQGVPYAIKKISGGKVLSVMR